MWSSIYDDLHLEMNSLYTTRKRKGGCVLYHIVENDLATTVTSK